MCVCYPQCWMIKSLSENKKPTFLQKFFRDKYLTRIVKKNNWIFVLCRRGVTKFSEFLYALCASFSTPHNVLIDLIPRVWIARTIYTCLIAANSRRRRELIINIWKKLAIVALTLYICKRNRRPEGIVPLPPHKRCKWRSTKDTSVDGKLDTLRKLLLPPFFC